MFKKENKPVNWPAILKHSDDAELVYIKDQDTWDNDTDLHNFEYDVTDHLIDSSGIIFNLAHKENHYITPIPDGNVMELKYILGLVKAHAAQSGSCCVAKLYAPSIPEAYKIVEFLNET